MIFGLSSKISGGKDTVAKIIQYLVAQSKIDYDLPYTLHEYLEGKDVYNVNHVKEYKESISEDSTWQNKKFAGKLKEIVCILLGCTLQQLEDREFKEKELGEEWDKYELHWSDGWDGNISIVSKDFNEEDYLDKKGQFYGHLGKKISLTPRLLLQLLGTECGRNIIHPNIWVNALMSEYIARSPYPAFKRVNGEMTRKDKFYPNWIISDMRFPNEMKAVKDRCGITIRVERFQEHDLVDYNDEVHTIIHCGKDTCLIEGQDTIIHDVWYGDITKIIKNEHESEKSLDNAEFDYVIYNTGTVEDLVEIVKQILTKENIL